MPNEPTPTSPRAFATATGMVFQVAGFVYFVGAAAYWFASGRLQSVATVPVERIGDYFDRSNILLSVTTANVLAAVVAGLAIAAFGLGMQAEKRGAGIGAMITTGLLTLTSVISAGLYIAYGPSWLRVAAVLSIGVVSAVLFLLAGHSTAILKHHPPPPDQSIVTDAWLEEYERTRRP